MPNVALNDVSIIVPSRLKKGPVIVASILAKKLIKNGCRVRVWYLRETKDECFEGVSSQKLTIRNFFEVSDSQVIHSHSLRPDIINLFLKLILRSKAKHLSTIHNFVQADLSYDYGFVVSKVVSEIWLQCWKRLDLCVSLSKCSYDYYSEFSLSTAVINNGVDPAVDYQNTRLRCLCTNPVIKLISTSSITKRKNLSLLIKSLQAHDGLRVVLVGDGPEKELLELEAQRLGVEDKVTFLGFQENVYDALLEADVFVLPSRSEGHPLGLIEAASIGLPSLVSDIPELKEFFCSDEVSFFNPDSTEDFRIALNACLSNYSSYSKNIKNKYLHKYTADIMYQNYLRMYIRLINE